MEAYVGLDVHSKRSVFLIEGAAGQVRGRGDIPTTPAGLATLRTEYGLAPGTPVALETGTITFYVARQLQALDLVPVVIDAHEVRLKAHRPTQKSDRRDAFELCEGLRRGSCRAIVHVPPLAISQLRETLSRRRHFVRMQTAEVNAVKLRVARRRLVMSASYFEEFDVLSKSMTIGSSLTSVMYSSLGSERRASNGRTTRLPLTVRQMVSGLRSLSIRSCASQANSRSVAGGSLRLLAYQRAISLSSCLSPLDRARLARPVLDRSKSTYVGADQRRCPIQGSRNACLIPATCVVSKILRQACCESQARRSRLGERLIQLSDRGGLVCRRQVAVAKRHLKRLVAEQLVHGGKADACHHEVAREAVPEIVPAKTCGLGAGVVDATEDGSEAHEKRAERRMKNRAWCEEWRRRRGPESRRLAAPARAPSRRIVRTRRARDCGAPKRPPGARARRRWCARWRAG
jgi:Transposase